MNEAFKIIECPRDAWQGLPRVIPTAEKVAYLRALVDAGFRQLDAVSFVSPRHVPQMADSETVLGRFLEEGPESSPSPEIIGIVVNEKGMKRALAAPGVTTLGFPLSLSGTFQRRNAAQSMEEAWEFVEALRETGASHSRGVVVYLSMAFGNPYGDSYSHNKVAEEVHRLCEMGIRTVSLADTVGAAGEEEVGDLFRTALPYGKESEIGLHLHSRPDEARSKVRAAVQAGCRRLDTALVGLGGCPFASDALVGNLPTEEAVAQLEEMDVEVDVGSESLGRVLQLTEEISRQYGQKESG